MPERIDKAEPGQLWELPLAGAGLLGWVVVRRHPEDPDLVLLVPADAEVGLAEGDLAAPLTWQGSPEGERCVLRVAYGGWLPARDLWFRVPGAEVTSAWLEELGEPGSADPDGLGSLPLDLQDWLRDELGPARQALEAWRLRVRERPELYPVIEDAAGRVAEAPEPPDALPLAAAGSDALDRVLAEHAGDGEGAGEELQRELAGGLEGRPTLLRLTTHEVQLEVGGTTEPPRCLFLGPAGGRSFLRWTRHLHGGWRSQPVDLAELEAPPLRLVVEGERVHDLELDP